MSRAERKAKHAEANKQLWESAENPERAYFLEAKRNVPLKTDFKPAVTVLSRKPTPQIASRKDAANGMASLTLDDEDDSEEEARKKNEAVFAERQRKAALEREEKQRKYAEVRERLFGPSESASRESSEGRGASTGRGGSAPRRGRTQNTRSSQPTSSADQSPARPSGGSKQLYDPGYTAKPRRDEVQRSATPKAEQPIRMPRGPDGSGRGGFGFASRGGLTGS